MATIFGDKVTSNTVTFNDAAENPAGAVIWKLDTLDGWDETPAIDLETVPLGGGADGELLPEFASDRAKYIVASGYVMAEDRAAAETLHDLIIGSAFPRNVDLVLTRYETVPKYMTVRVSSKREIARVGPTMFRWVIPLIAGDPRKYDADPPGSSTGTAGVSGQSTTGFTFPVTFPLVFTQIESGSTVQSSLTVTNRGTAPTDPYITLTGPLLRGGWRIANETTGEEIRFDLGLGAGESLEIDFKRQLALLNGYPVTSTIIGDFWKVVPGVNVIKLYADFDPASSITVTIESAWE